jgi:hypothetical protein
MPIEHLGKLLYPRLEPWERRRNIKRIIWSILGTVALAAAVIVISFKKNAIGK